MALLAGAATVQAVPVIYNNEAVFLAAAGGASMESFEGLTATNDFQFGRSFAVPAFTFALGTPANPHGGGVRNAPFGGTHATDGVQYIVGSTGGGSNFPVVLTFNSAIKAFGINITDYGDDSFEAGSTMAFSTSSGATGNTGLLLMGDGNTQFFGIIDTTSFLSITIQRDPSGGGLNIGYDEVYFTANVAGVPEPSMLLLIALGLAALALALRRKTQLATA